MVQFVFKDIAEWNGLQYFNWINDKYPENWRKDEKGDYTVVDLDAYALEGLYRGLV